MKIKQTLKYFWLIVIAIAITALLFSSCSSNINTVSPYSAEQIANIIISSQNETGDIPSLRKSNLYDDYFSYYLSNIYQLRYGSKIIKDGIIYYAGGMLGDEIAIFLIDEDADADIKKIQDSLQKYIKRRINVFAGYAPEQAVMLENSIVIIRGNYVALLICKDPEKAKSQFLACFSDDPPELPFDLPDIIDINESIILDKTDENPGYLNSQDIYDHGAILAAYKSNSVSDILNLSDKNRKIFDACVNIIAAVIKDNMSVYDKELAIHDWIIEWADYDEETGSNAPEASPDPDNDNPYGLLINKKAICMGYSSTFKLFMDMLDIECIIVEGSSGEGADNSEHAWNMVRIDGKWYCVDVTWDDPIIEEQNEKLNHNFFNVTNDFMWETGHRWDENAFPKAVE